MIMVFPGHFHLVFKVLSISKISFYPNYLEVASAVVTSCRNGITSLLKQYGVNIFPTLVLLEYLALVENIMLLS